MNFRGGAAARGRASQTTLEVTSLIDVVFLLIIFLLVTTTFKESEYAFVIDLPTSSSEQVSVSTDKTTVFITKDGDYFLLEIRADGAVPKRLDAKSKVTAEQLKGKLAALYKDKPEAAIAVRGEKTTNYQTLMGVVGILQDTGFKSIWFPYELDPAP